MRTNKELSAFIKAMLDRNKINNNFAYRNVNILFAQNKITANNLIEYYKNKGYTFINHTSSSFKSLYFDDFIKDFNAHEVIGQEFDKVLVVLNNSFAYNESKILSAYENSANPNYLFSKMLYQEITRVREKLCILIIENIELFKEIISIVKRNNK